MSNTQDKDAFPILTAPHPQPFSAAERRFKSLKATLIPDCRKTWRGPHASYISAAVVLDEQGNPQWPSLLGTGGNDGNLDFTNNLMQRFIELFDMNSADGGSRDSSERLLRHALRSRQQVEINRPCHR